MGWYTPSSRLQFFRSYPKVDLHRHLEGSLRLKTLLDVACQHGITLPVSPDLSNLVQMQPGDKLNFSTFLSKFKYLHLFYRSEEVIRRVTREAVQDAAEDNVQYLELRFTPVVLTRAQDLSLAEVMDWVAGTARQAGQEFGVTVRLIASVNRHESVSLAEQVAGLAVERMAQGIVGLDLAGNEADFSAKPFASTFQQAKKCGLFLTVHAGEWGGADNVREALENLGADRIGHGVQVMQDPALVDLARERKVPFEVCLTSNSQTGAVSSLAEHPVRRMLQAGLNVTLNSDDPSISGITLGDDYRLAVEALGMAGSELAKCVLQAANAAFLSEAERGQLVIKLAAQLAELKN
ncbi:MAG TPA: adenosine deaminase [Anaerolineaceae bacterium]